MKHYFVSFFASYIVVVRNVVRLITDPYKAMREVSREHDLPQVAIILALSCSYFVYATGIRESTLNPFVISRSALTSSVVFLVTFGISVALLYGVSRALKCARPHLILPLVHLSAYALIPSFFWFFMTSTLFVLIPPPRQFTTLGILFSVVFVVYSLSLLLWRLVLLYLTIRFAFGTAFKTTVAVMIIYMAWLLPYSYLLYKLGFLRVPFI